ncbi:hypothetical protein F2Q70_00011365 [Brassica cretica]|uniref:Uncharacterized protein n=1 Tax=Brassica cretica TaxID=69181 RepID=A0A8S9LQ25_BRACR|nr:hypothetical protein F2Q70_00011365 [Brassica cretica]
MFVVDENLFDGFSRGFSRSGLFCGSFADDHIARLSDSHFFGMVRAPKVFVSFRFQAFQRFAMSPLLWCARMDLTESLHEASPPMIMFIRLRR